MKYKYLLLTGVFLGIEFGLVELAFSMINSSDDFMVAGGFAVLLIGGPAVLFKYVDVLNNWSKNVEGK